MEEYRCLYCGELIKNDPRENAKVCIKCTTELIRKHSLSLFDEERRLTKEQKRFIAEQYQNKDKSEQQIVLAFKEKFGWFLSFSEIDKYKNYPIDEHEPDEEPDENIN